MLSDNLKQRQPVPRRRRRQVLGRVRVVLGVAAPAPLRRDEEAALVAPRPGGGPRVRGQARGPPVEAATILTSNGERAKQVMGEKHPLTTQFLVNIFDLYTRMSARPECPESSAPSPAAFEEKVEEAD